MGRKQEERAQRLVATLERRMREAMHAAGWRVVEYSKWGPKKEIWRYEGQAAFERERQLAHLAKHIWRGRFSRVGAEKVADLALVDPALLRALPGQEFQAIGDGLEVAVDREASRVRVRRQRKVGESQHTTMASQQVAVVGDEEAHGRGTAPAYRRMVSTRAITFTCAWCGQNVTQQRFPSPKPMYCSDICREEASRERTRERVERLRERRRAARASSDAPGVQ